jgi:hypothetical protein
LKAFSDHSQLVALIIVSSTKECFPSMLLSRVIMNFKIRQKDENDEEEAECLHNFTPSQPEI